MAETKSRAEFKAIPSDKEGLISSWVTQSSEFVERGVGTCFELLRDVRGEVKQRVTGTLDWVESSQQGFIKLGRGMTERVDRLAEDAIGTAENLAIGVVRAVRDVGHGVTEIASRATASLAKPREERLSRAA
jgi:hypothetical protein